MTELEVGGPRHAAAVVATTALLFAAALSGATVGAAETDTSWVAVTDGAGGSTVEATAGETVTVTVVTNASNVSAYQSNLTFDPDVVRIASVSRTDAFEDPVTNVDNGSGWVAFNQYRPSNVDGPQLATVTVELVGESGSQTTLSLVESDTKLSDDEARERHLQRYYDLTVTVESDSTESNSTQSEVPGFGVTTALTAGALLFGYLRFGRRER